MTPEQATGIALTAVGLGAFGFLLRVRARKAAGGSPSGRGSLAPFKVITSPDGNRVAVVLAGAPFEDRLDRVVETGLWWLLWMLPARLCRIEVWVFDVPGDLRGMSTALDRILDRPPAAKRLIWRGQGHPRVAGEVEIAWAGAGEVHAGFRGTSHRIEMG